MSSAVGIEDIEVNRPPPEFPLNDEARGPARQPPHTLTGGIESCSLADVRPEVPDRADIVAADSR